MSSTNRVGAAAGGNHTSGVSSGGFHSFAGHASQIVGSKWSFTLAAAMIVVWGVTGPYFHYSDTWQLVVNTATTVVTFLIVFLIQNTQNRDARAIHLKLDEIIHAIGRAHNEMIHIEDLSDTELQEISKKFEAIRAKCEQRKAQAKS
jgi:low affinity Fe/Cu permease